MERVRPARIGELLAPLQLSLSHSCLDHISIYIDMLLRWNSRINLTAIRDPEEIVTRHFGESLFAAGRLLAASNSTLVDVGSGAGFPGLPIKIWKADLKMTLIESNHKKATFLREVIRALTLTDIDVYSGRAETYPPSSANTVTLRAVERFSAVLPVAARLVSFQGSLALLIGTSQVEQTRRLLPDFVWNPAISIPSSQSRVLLLGARGSLNATVSHE